MFSVYLTKKAEKHFQKIATLDKRKILAKLDLLTYPFPTELDIKHLVGVDDFYRLRVGKLRVIFEVDKNKKEIWVRRIGYRGGVYGMM